MGDKALTFRHAFFPIWRVTTTCSSAFLATFYTVITLARGTPFFQPPQILLTVVCAVASGTLAVIPIALFRVYLTAEGIRCYDFFGVYHFSRWAAIDDVRPINLLGLRYLRVRSSDVRRRLWVPLFLSDMTGFGETVARLAGPDHPLTQSWPREARRITRGGSNAGGQASSS